MLSLSDWAKRHGIPGAAIRELISITQTEALAVPTNSSPLSERGVQQRVRVQFAERGGALWRNNVGVYEDAETGVYVRFGLANESPQMNAAIKSSDLIGIMPRKITHADVGTVIGQFVAREVKHEGWTFKGTERETAQMKWLMLILSLGGDAAFTTGK